jgi:hypothetical protein
VTHVADSYLGVRLEALRKAQNPDGGWAYFPGKRSWLEPTVYAALALAGEPAADRAWSLLKTWQGADGSWRPSSDVAIENFGTALCVTLALSQAGAEGAVNKGINWLLGTAGTESSWVNRVLTRSGIVELDRDLSLKGWPWKPGTSSWVEPTAHALVALKKAAAKHAPPADVLETLRERVRQGEAQLLDVRCRDGGWNYGNRSVRKVDLPAYPETSGIALAGLQGHSGLGPSLDYAAREAAQTRSPLGRAWLVIALRLHGASVPPASSSTSPPPPDLQILALEALAAPEGNFKAFETPVVSEGVRG